MLRRVARGFLTSAASEIHENGLSVMSSRADDGDGGVSSGEVPALSTQEPSDHRVMFIRSDLYNEIACSLQHLGARQSHE